MRPTRLLLLVTTTALAAQEPSEWNALLRDRVRTDQDLIELRYRRDQHGLLEVASSEHGARPFAPMFPQAEAWPMRSIAGTLLTGVQLLFGNGSTGVLGCTDSERHLRRAGIEPGVMVLRQFLVAPMPADDPVRARVELLDRLVAIDWLQRGGHLGAVAELTALATRPDTPPLLAARAAAALTAFGRRPANATRSRLAPESLALPATADGYLVVDHGRLPDLAPLHALARRLAIDSSYRVVEVLRAPTPDDLYFGQWVADVLGELPFEVARRYGNMRFDHTVVALLAPAPQGLTLQALGWSVQSAGEFEHAPLVAALQAAAERAPAELQCEQRDGALLATTPLGEARFGPTAIAAHSKGMGGRARPELARELLAEGPAIRVVIPPTSKLWPALALLKLPPTARAELTVSFGEEFRIGLALTARDDDAAAAWAERGRRLVAATPDEIRAAFEQLAAAFERSVPTFFRPMVTPRPGATKEVLQPLVDAVAATRITTDGTRVEAVLTSRTMGWPLLWAARAFGPAPEGR